MPVLNYGLIGETLGHSISPQIHALIYDALGISANYQLYEIEKTRLASLKNALYTLHIQGVNVTIPYKNAVIPQMDALEETAQVIGAVNTIALKEDGQCIGYNTDYYGLEKTFAYMGLSVEGLSVVVLGNGGASKALQAVLQHKGAKSIEIVTRHKEDAFLHYEALPSLGKRDMIINTTPVGMYPKTGVSAVEASVFSQFSYALDLIYNPLETQFLKDAKVQGLVTESGLYMLVYQAIRAEEIWLSQSISADLGEEIYQKMKLYLEKGDKLR